MSPWEFGVTGPVEATVRVPSGMVTVQAQPTQTAIVKISASDRRGEEAVAAVKVEYEDGRLSIIAPEPSRFLRSSPKLDVSVTLPPGSVVTADTGSADVRGSGELARLAVNTASGDVRTDLVTGQVDVSSASGAVRLDRPGRANVKTISGGIVITDAAGDTDSQTVSGNVTIDSVKVGKVSVKSASGNITVAVPTGIGVQLDLSTISGKVRSELNQGQVGQAEAIVVCRSVSGDVTARRAA
jgi:DUF4097 and DUF4098 domain-containing protein YvlB